MGRSVCTAALLVALLGSAPAACNSAPGEKSDTQSENTVPFDHFLHASQYQISCVYCHTYADKATVAGIPSVRKCMGCHKFAGKDKESIRKLATMFDEGTAPSWAKIYDVPDYVYFSHRVHVRADVGCNTCHGPVEAMRGVERVKDHDMGFCVRCHRERRASLDCLACHK